MLFFEQYVRIKIENQKILFLMSKLLPKLNEINVSYPYKHSSVKLSWISSTSLIYHIIKHFFYPTT